MGTMQGVVTLEDVVETLIGLEITDELDKDEDMQVLAQKRWRERMIAMGVDPDGVDWKASVLTLMRAPDDGVGETHYSLSASGSISPERVNSRRTKMTGAPPPLTSKPLTISRVAKPAHSDPGNNLMVAIWTFFGRINRTLRLEFSGRHQNENVN